MSAAERRKLELEEKKKKLAELKQRNAAGATGSSSPTVGPAEPKPQSPAQAPRAKPEDSIDALLGDVGRLLPQAKAPEPEPSPTTTTTSSVASPISTPTTRRKVQLSIKVLEPIEILPNRITYDKGTQFPDPLTATGAEEEVKAPQLVSHKRVGKHGHKKEEEESTETTTETETSAEAVIEEPKEPEIPQLAEEVKAEIMDSVPFKDFFDKTSRIMDRALYMSEALDIMEDYKSVDEQTKNTATHEAVLKATLFDERWSKHRSVTDLGWSHKHPELVLSSYSANEGGSHDPDGVVLVWNANTFFQKPEFVFNCQSTVMTAQFSKFHSTIIAGGTYSGQIVLWDTRARAMPVQRTPLSAIGHTHPVYSVSIVGSANAHNLVSVSTDGKLCVWSLDNLSAPLETLELSHKLLKSVTAAAPVAVTSLSFQEGEVNQFYVGSEEGAVFQAYRHGTTSGVTERYEGHFGPITATDFHPARGSIDFSHLLLSASTDWTVKLWSPKFGTKSLFSFEDAADYVYDARWSPTHPAVFATVDGTGYLDIWNMNEDIEAPVIKVKAATRAVNRAAWSADGHRVMAGDAAGYMYLYDVGEVGVPDANEWNRFEEVLTQLGTATAKPAVKVTRDDDYSVSDDFSTSPSDRALSSAIDSTA